MKAEYNYTWEQAVNWPAFKEGGYLNTILDSELEVQSWQSIFECLYNTGKPNTWDYSWTLTCWQNGGLTALPNVNLVSNIGFGSDGTHTLGESRFANFPVGKLGEIRHPSFLVRDCLADQYTFDYLFGGKSMREANTFKGKLRSVISTTKHRIKRLFTDPVGLLSAFCRRFLVASTS